MKNGTAPGVACEASPPFGANGSRLGAVIGVLLVVASAAPGVLAYRFSPLRPPDALRENILGGPVCFFFWASSSSCFFF